MITVPAIVMVGTLPMKSDIQPKIRDPSNKPDNEDMISNDATEDEEQTKHSESSTEGSEVRIVTDNVPLHGDSLREVRLIIGPHLTGGSSIVVISTSATKIIFTPVLLI